MRCPFMDEFADGRTVYRVALFQENDLNSIIRQVGSGSNSNSVMESISSNPISGNNLLVVSLRRNRPNCPATDGPVAFTVSRDEILSDREQCLRFVNQNILVSSNEPPPQVIVQHISDLLYDYASIMERDPLNSNHRVLMVYMHLAFCDLAGFAPCISWWRTAEHRRQHMECVLGVRRASFREENTKKYRVRFDYLNNFDDGIGCSICLEGFDSGDVITKTFCRLFFHVGCVVKWWKNHQTCPICRFPVEFDS